MPKCVNVCLAVHFSQFLPVCLSLVPVLATLSIFITVYFQPVPCACLASMSRQRASPVCLASVPHLPVPPSGVDADPCSPHACLIVQCTQYSNFACTSLSCMDISSACPILPAMPSKSVLKALVQMNFQCIQHTFRELCLSSCHQSVRVRNTTLLYALCMLQIDQGEETERF